MLFDHNELDDVIHGRLRLAIMAYLISAQEAEFTAIKTAVETSDGNLSTHLRKLEDAGYITVKKGYKGRKPQTLIRLSNKGESAFRNYLEKLAALLENAKG